MFLLSLSRGNVSFVGNWPLSCSPPPFLLISYSTGRKSEKRGRREGRRRRRRRRERRSTGRYSRVCRWVFTIYILPSRLPHRLSHLYKKGKKKKKKKEKRKVRLFSSKSQAGAFQCRSNYREDDCRSLAATTTTASQRASKSLLRLPQSHPFLRLGARRPQLCCDLTSVSALLDCLSPAGETRIGCRSLTATCLVCLPKEELVSAPSLCGFLPVLLLLYWVAPAPEEEEGTGSEERERGGVWANNPAVVSLPLAARNWGNARLVEDLWERTKEGE